MSEALARKGWLDVAEVGSVWGIRFVVGLCMVFGRGLGRAFLRVLILYYVCLHGTARRASRDYLRRVGAPAGFWDAYRHLLTFADVALDRLLFAAGKFSLFHIESHGREYLERLARERRGALLVGAHLGSFEAMRAGAVTQSLPINMVVNFKNARQMQAVLEQLDPSANVRLISVDEGSVDFVLRIRECIERGEMVAILADRVGGGGRAVKAGFLGDEASFSAGPFVLASVLRCPVLLTFGLYRGGNRYDLYCEPFAEQLELPRKRRDEALAEVVQRFAARLEHYARMAPSNWFNFYDFWSNP
jgi:predicted LPLAT superfamily acyltransferase